MMNSFERDTVAEIKARARAGRPVADWEKQLVLNLLRREGGVVRREVVERARAQGFDVEGIQTR